MGFSHGRTDWVEFLVLRKKTSMKAEDWGRFSIFLTTLSCSASLSALLVSALSIKWKDAFFIPSVADWKSIFNTCVSVSSAAFNKNLSILNAQMRLTSFYAISLISARTCGWFWNSECDSGAGVERCSTTDERPLSSDHKAYSKVSSGFNIVYFWLSVRHWGQHYLCVVTNLESLSYFAS